MHCCWLSKQLIESGFVVITNKLYALQKNVTISLTTNKGAQPIKPNYYVTYAFQTQAALHLLSILSVEQSLRLLMVCVAICNQKNTCMCFSGSTSSRRTQRTLRGMMSKTSAGMLQLLTKILCHVTCGCQTQTVMLLILSEERSLLV